MAARGSYPSISLADAVSRVETLYKKEGRHPADREVIAQALGYKSRNGASDSVIAALGYYDLLTDAGEGQLRISSNALDILLGDRGDPDRVRAIQEVAFLHPLFAELRKVYGDGQVSDRNLEAFLVRRDFNPSTVKKAIRSYRDTIEFVKQETEGFSDPSAELQEVSMQPQTQTQATPQISGIYSAPVAPVAAPVSKGASLQQQVLTVPISDSSYVSVVFVGPMTEEAIRDVIRHLELAADRAARTEGRTAHTPNNTVNSGVEQAEVGTFIA